MGPLRRQRPLRSVILAPRCGVAYGAVIGLGGLIVDIGARNFTTPTALGVFFSVPGIAAVAVLATASRLLRSRRLGARGGLGE